jgi:hypothetical protein
MGDDDLTRLPHWARVAFAARCGRFGAELFCVNWPTADPDRLAAVLGAIEKAEQSAATGSAIDGVGAMALDACRTAGAALIASKSLATGQLVAASLAAKPAEFAARAAAAGPSGSAEAVSQAFGAIIDLAMASGVTELVHKLDADLTRLSWAAAAGEWNDETPVPPSVFGPK